MSKRYFGTDGIRGEVGQSPMTVDFALRLASAAAGVLASGGGSVLIGKDTRVSGYMFESALEAGFVASGVDVLLTGPLPTPAVAYLTRTLGADFGIVISASHNPYYDNGIKFFDREGEKFSDELEEAIEARLDETPATHSSQALGQAQNVSSARADYQEFCKSTIPDGMRLSGLKIVVDASHGAAYKVAPRVMAELGAEVMSAGIHCVTDRQRSNLQLVIARAVPDPDIVALGPVTVLVSEMPVAFRHRGLTQKPAERAASAVVMLLVIEIDDGLTFHVGLTGEQEDPELRATGRGVRLISILLCGCRRLDRTVDGSAR